jgi:hypothetical protein
MHDQAGRTIALSLPRRLITDLVYFARKVPTIPVQRRLNVSAVRDARAQLADRPSWSAIFLKAYGFVATAFPELRRAFLPCPWARLYEHPVNIASFAIERMYQGEPAVFFAHIRSPEEQGLHELDAEIRRHREEPIESFGLFRRALKMSRLPLPLRRLMWWIGLNQSGYKRAKRMGTFGLSVYSGLGAESLHPLSPLTTTLTYGVIADDGMVDARLVYDHRVMDGAVVARALACLERVLNQEILAELQLLKRRAAA